MKTQLGYDFNKEEIIWLDVEYAFLGAKKKDQKHSYPANSRGPVLAYAIFAAIVFAAILIAVL